MLELDVLSEDRPSTQPVSASKTFRVLDTFAGAGGFSLGFEQAGCTVVGGVERDSWACETFSQNHPGAKVFQRDITTFEDGELEDAFRGIPPTILLGGPPCQGYSICNRDNGDPKDPRNSLFQNFLQVAKALQPDVLVMENVPNIVKARTHSGQLVIEIIRRELERLDYYVYSTLLEAVNFGVPQIRKRFFVIASKKALKQPFPPPTHSVGDVSLDSLFGSALLPTPTLWEAISDLPQIASGQGGEITDYTGGPQNDYQRLMRVGSDHLHNHIAMRHGKRMVERFSAMSWGTLVSDLPEHLRPRKRNSAEIAAVIYDQNNRRMFPHRPCHTLPASFYANFVHPYCHRNFTPREGARIQSFPDTFVFKGKPTVVSHALLAREGRVEELHLCQYNQIGNAVPPLMAKALADNLLRQL